MMARKREIERAVRKANEQIAAAEARGISVIVEDDPEEYMMGDLETEVPQYVLWIAAFHTANLGWNGRPDRGAECLASVGGVGVNSPSDPYVTICRGEIAVEALAYQDARDQDEANEMASRATYAGACSDDRRTTR
jgi:hypothetical protein